MASSKVALITGAGSGIGQAIALQLFKDGYSLILAGRRRDALEETAKLAGADADSVLAFPTDVAKEEEVEALFAACAQRFGRLDLLFNNAGIFTPAASLEDVTLEQWQSAIDVNLTGAFLCTQHAFRMMK